MNTAEHLSYLAKKFIAETGLQPTHIFIPDETMDNLPTREGYAVKISGAEVLASTDLDAIVVSHGRIYPTK